MNVCSRPLRKTVVFFLAVTIMALGVILSTKAVLGTSPISSIPYVLSLGIHMSIGSTTFIINLIMVAFGILMMGRFYKPIYLFQIVMVVMFSVLCDVFSYIVDWIVLTNYIVQWGMIILAAVVLSFGISLELAANVTMMPGEYLVSFISIRTGVEFGKVKVLFDIIMISIAIVASFFFFGALNGIREGTIFAAVSIGFIVRFFTKFLKDSGFYDWLGHKDISMIRNVKTPEELQ